MASGKQFFRFAWTAGGLAALAATGCVSATTPAPAGVDGQGADPGNVAQADAAAADTGAVGGKDAEPAKDTGGGTGGDAAVTDTPTGQPDTAQPPADVLPPKPDGTAASDFYTPPPDGWQPGVDGASASDGSIGPGGCMDNKACNPGMFCSKPQGQCGAPGTCKQLPTACTKELFQVCGCDGKTYGNPCNAEAAGTTVATVGECGTTPPPAECFTADSSKCGAGKYCKGNNPGCMSQGKCVDKPQACTMEYAPVCGCDGKEYGNVCGAAAAGQNVASNGKCAAGGGGCTIGGSDCAANEFCKAATTGTCTGKGTCVAKSQVCPTIYKPVCGCDGKTYGNDCEAGGAGQNVAAAMACGGGGGGDLKMYLSCGAPVCSGWKPKPDVPLCTTQKAGDACTVEGSQCDPQDGCNAVLICAAKDPKIGPCPISKAKYKSDIQYVAPQQAEELAKRLLATRLATYKYTAQGPAAPTRLGFIIDDDPQSPAVDAQRDMVDLYGYLSMAVATLQTQQKEIDALRSELAKLKAGKRPSK